jgi:hypothetical protein
MDAWKLVQLLLTALVGILSAWWAGRLGVVRALEQKKGEFAFQRRIEWYENAVAALSELGTAQGALAQLLRHGFPSDVVQQSTLEMMEKQAAVGTILRQAGLYAKPESAGLLMDYVNFSRVEFEYSKPLELDPRQLEDFSAKTSWVNARLAIEFRAQLGLEPMPHENRSSSQLVEDGRG